MESAAQVTYSGGASGTGGILGEPPRLAGGPVSTSRPSGKGRTPTVHDPHGILYAAALLAYLYGQVEIAANRLDVMDQPGAAVAAGMAHEALGEALCRLGVPLPGKSDDAQQDPLVLRVQTRVSPDQ